MQNLDTQIAKITKEKKNAEESNKSLSDQLQAEEDKVNHLQKLKQKMEANLDEVSDRRSLWTHLYSCFQRNIWDTGASLFAKMGEYLVNLT